MERNKNYSTQQWFPNNSNNISLHPFDMKHQNMLNPEINTFWFNICISFPCWWKKQVSQVVVSGQNRVLQGIWSKGTSLWRLDWWTKVLLSLSDHALSKTHTLGLLLWLVWGLHLSKLLICRMVMPSIKNDPQTNTTEAHLPSLPPEAISHLKSSWSPNSTKLHLDIYLFFLLCKYTNLRNTTEAISHIKSAQADGFCCKDRLSLFCK